MWCRPCEADTAVKHVLVTSVGDLLGFPKGALVDFVLRHVTAQGAGLEHPRLTTSSPTCCGTPPDSRSKT